MKYYSEKTKKLYASEQELNEAEAALEAKNAQQNAEREQRKADAKKVQDAAEKAIAAKREYDKELSSFLRKYGSYHTTITSVLNDMDSDFTSFIRSLFM